MKWTIFLLAFIISCSSVQVLKNANEDDAKAQQHQTEIEKQRTKTISELIQNSNLTDTEKKLIIAELKSKDEQLEVKDQIIAGKNKEIQAYQHESTKAVEKSETKIDACVQEQKKCLVDAGAGKVLYIILGVIVFAGLIYLVYLILTKFNVMNFLKGNKET